MAITRRFRSPSPHHAPITGRHRLLDDTRGSRDGDGDEDEKVALINAIDRWEPETGATLEQYAWTRVHGAVLDEMRTHDWAPRSLRRWQREMTKARQNFTALDGRALYA